MSHTLSGNEWPWETTSGTKSYYELQRVVQQMATSGSTSDNEWYNEWHRVVQRVTTRDSDWQRMTKNDKDSPFRLIFPFFE